jgi:hypothetical protein
VTRVQRAIDHASPYHVDGGAEGSLVVVEELKAGELAELTAIGAQGPASKDRGASSNRQNAAGCGVGSSGRMCQGGHRAHRGSGGGRVHCDRGFAGGGQDKVEIGK